MSSTVIDTTVTPNVIIAGVTKAGSTSLFTYLGDHPDVCGSTVKEISHFVTVRFREPPRPLENYNQYFQHWQGQSVRLESSPAYFLGGQELAETIKRTLPDVKIIIVLREPISRFKSHFDFNKSMLRLPKEMSLGEYVQKCQSMPLESFRSRDNYVYYGLASGIYADYIDGWINTFGDNLHICFFDELKRNPREFTQGLCRWLGLDESYYQDYGFVVENKSRDFSSPALQRLALKFNKKFESFLRRNIAVKRTLRSIYYSMNGSKSSRNQADEEQQRILLSLKKYYGPHNDILRERLLETGVENLPEWLQKESTGNG